MSRSYWGIGLALILAATPLWGQEHGNSGGEQPSPQQSTESSTQQPPVVSASDSAANQRPEPRIEQSDPYRDERNQREKRDVEAQESMAGWAQAMFWAVIAQTLLALFALVALIADLRQNRRSAEAQLRAYLTVEPGGVNESKDGRMRVPLHIHNAGQTPAFKVMIFSNFGISKDPISETAEELAAPLVGQDTDMSIGPGVERWVHAYARYDFVKDHLADIDAKKSALIHVGYVAYQDAFGNARETRFAFYHWGNELSDENALRCRFGNTAT